MSTPVPDLFADATARLAAAVHAGEGAAAAAAALRRLLRTDAGAWTACRRLLVHGKLESPVRAALALVLGTIPNPETDDVLLEALATLRGRQDPIVLVALLHGLGATRTPADADEIFDYGDRPWGVVGPGRLGITVSRPIEDASVALILTSHLWDPRLPAEARAAAVASLRHSLGRPQVLADFRAVLRQETVDGVASGIGEALAVWARSHRGAESTAVIRELIARSGTPSFDSFRFHVEDELAHIALDEMAVGQLMQHLAPTHSFALRSWALEVLGHQPGVEVTHRLCRMATEDADPAMRDAAVRLLRQRNADANVRRVLTRVVHRDAAWQVRYAALGSLPTAPRAEILAVLRRATSDPDTRVRARARAILDHD